MLKEYTKRFIYCGLSLMLYGFGSFLGVKAGAAGTNAWNTLSLGISEMTGVSFGTATLLISVVIVAIDFFGKGKLGFGTLLNALLIPLFSDLFLALFAFMPNASGAVAGALCTLAGQTIVSFATILYMLPALGSYRRSIVRPSVLFPQPLSPTRPSVSPFSMEKLMSSLA